MSNNQNMYCSKCGNPVIHDSPFCSFCGALLKKYGKPVNPNNDTEVNNIQAEPKSQLQEAALSKKRGQGKKMRIAILAAALCLVAIIGVLLITGVFSKQANGQNTLERPDARSYLNEYGTIIRETKVSNSNNVYTEAQAYAKLTALGFDGNSITASYDMNGVLIDETVINPNGSAKHPYYQLLLFSDNDIVWVVTYINGHILAQAYVDEMLTGESRLYYYSDSTAMDFYDSKYNAFFEIQPDTSKHVLKTLGRIDADVLNSISHWEVVD